MPPIVISVKRVACEEPPSPPRAGGVAGRRGGALTVRDAVGARSGAAGSGRGCGRGVARGMTGGCSPVPFPDTAASLPVSSAASSSSSASGAVSATASSSPVSSSVSVGAGWTCVASAAGAATTSGDSSSALSRRLLGRDRGFGARGRGGHGDGRARADRDRRGRAGAAAVAARGGDGLRRADGGGALDGGLGLAQPLLRVRNGKRLDLAGALGRTAGPIAQALELARLGEVEDGQDGEAEKRGKPDVGAVLLDLMLERERE